MLGDGTVLHTARYWTELLPIMELCEQDVVVFAPRHANDSRKVGKEVSRVLAKNPKAKIILLADGHTQSMLKERTTVVDPHITADDLATVIKGILSPTAPPVQRPNW
jgi:hypothetical protein